MSVDWWIVESSSSGGGFVSGMLQRMRISDFSATPMAVLCSCWCLHAAPCGMQRHGEDRASPQKESGLSARRSLLTVWFGVVLVLTCCSSFVSAALWYSERKAAFLPEQWKFEWSWSPECWAGLVEECYLGLCDSLREGRGAKRVSVVDVVVYQLFSFSQTVCKSVC